jgi:hypothetical protein
VVDTEELDEPVLPSIGDRLFSVYMPGAGGTGVLTLNGPSRWRH